MHLNICTVHTIVTGILPVRMAMAMGSEAVDVCAYRTVAATCPAAEHAAWIAF